MWALVTLEMLSFISKHVVIIRHIMFWWSLQSDCSPKQSSRLVTSDNNISPRGWQLMEIYGDSKLHRRVLWCIVRKIFSSACRLISLSHESLPRSFISLEKHFFFYFHFCDLVVKNTYTSDVEGELQLCNSTDWKFNFTFFRSYQTQRAKLQRYREMHFFFAHFVCLRSIASVDTMPHSNQMWKLSASLQADQKHSRSVGETK